MRILLCKMLRKMLCAIDRTMLAAGTAEGHHQTCKPTPGICLHMRINDAIDMLQESQNLPILLQKTDYRFILACQGFIRSISARIMY
jgi:hypothetical protein